MITSKQISGARAMLGMSQGVLATKTGLAITTISRIEKSEDALNVAGIDTVKKVKLVFEEAGIEFLDNESGIGVILKRKGPQERS